MKITLGDYAAVWHLSEGWRLNPRLLANAIFMTCIWNRLENVGAVWGGGSKFWPYRWQGTSLIQQLVATAQAVILSAVSAPILPPSSPVVYLASSIP